MGKILTKIIGNDPGEAIDNLLGGANRVITLSSNLRLSRDSKFSRVLNIIGVATSVGWAVRSGYEFLKDLRDDRSIYTIKISQNESLYEVAQRLAMASVPEEDKTDIVARVRWNSEGFADISTIFDSELNQEVRIRGHKAFISTSVYEDSRQEGRGHAVVSEDRSDRLRKKTSSIKNNDLIITCFSLEARNDILEELKSHILINNEREVQLYLARDWGAFHPTGMSKRSPESVILKDGQMDRIIKHLEVFLANEKAYADLGIPYHTGVLLYGPPGTGKTSITSVLSDHFGVDVYHISLNSVKGDTALFELFSEIDDNSIVLFEDVDVSSSASDRDSDESDKVTMSGLLNVLDGNLSPHGMISILTTNHKDSLDSAVIRPGRVDLVEHFDFVDQHQLESTCKYFMGYIPEDLPKISRNHLVSSADIVGVFRSNILDIPSTEQDLIKFLKKKIKKSEKKSKKVDNYPALVIQKEIA